METILVVEDEEEARLATVELLSALGYRVLQAADADSAIVLVESGVQIDLVFSDVSVRPRKSIVSLVMQLATSVFMLIGPGAARRAPFAKSSANRRPVCRPAAPHP